MLQALEGLVFRLDTVTGDTDCLLDDCWHPVLTAPKAVIDHTLSNDVTPLSAIGLEARSLNRCHEMGLHTVADVERTSDVEFLKARNVGKLTLKRLRAKIAETRKR